MCTYDGIVCKENNNLQPSERRSAKKCKGAEVESDLNHWWRDLFIRDYHLISFILKRRCTSHTCPVDTGLFDNILLFSRNYYSTFSGVFYEPLLVGTDLFSLLSQWIHQLYQHWSDMTWFAPGTMVPQQTEQICPFFLYCRGLFEKYYYVIGFVDFFWYHYYITTGILR